MVAQPRQLALTPDNTMQLPLELRPLRAGCAVMDCENEPKHELVNSIRTVVCRVHRDEYLARGWKERSLL